VPAASLEYRLRIRNQANSANLLVLSSRASDANCLLTADPQSDGQRIDWAMGTSEVGVVVWRAVDRDDGGSTRTITSKLADADARNQMLANVCVGEYSKDGGAWTAFHTGFLNAIRLVDALTFEFTVGDTNRREQDAELFKTLAGVFSRGSYLLGGPIPSIVGVSYGASPQRSFDKVYDFGPVRMQKVAGTAGSSTILLQLVGGYVRPYFRQSLTTVGADEVDTINRLARTWATPCGNRYGSGPAAHAFSDFPGLVAKLRRVSDGETFTTFPVAVPVVSTTADTDRLVVSKNLRLYLRWPAPLAVPSDGTQFDVVVYPNEVSENAPLHWGGHPVDLVTQAWTQEGIAYDATAATTVKNAIGSALWVEYRWTKSQKLTDVVADRVFGPFGIGARLDASARKVMFLTRGTVPASVDTVGVNDVPSDE